MITSTGGMTEEKRKMRRRVLAKWLKESILRLGPTFIKIGQQFSTRVDILPQEYVDQLSELQVCIYTSILYQNITRHIHSSCGGYLVSWKSGSVIDCYRKPVLSY
jgi:predicted unusual protein kinase regulating ubiquinone biosynthesis (AarF/ABC1/UbiB family)